MDNLALVFIEFISAVLCLFLLRFMIKPFRTTGESRYLGLPLGFAFLGISYIFMGFSLYFEISLLVEDLKWLQLFTQAYAFAFLAATYYFSKEPAKNTRLWWNITYAGLVFAAVVSYLVIFEPPMMEVAQLQNSRRILQNLQYYLSCIHLHSYIKKSCVKT